MAIQLVINKKEPTAVRREELVEAIYAAYCFIMQDSKSPRRKSAVLESLSEIIVLEGEADRPL